MSLALSKSFLLQKQRHLTDFSPFFHTYVSGKAHCYFNSEWIGEYVLHVPSTSSLTSVDVQTDLTLSKFYIEPDIIPILGECHKKIHQNFLLAEKYVHEYNIYMTIKLPTYIYIPYPRI